MGGRGSGDGEYRLKEFCCKGQQRNGVMAQEGQGRMLLRHGVFAARGSNKEVDKARERGHLHRFSLRGAERDGSGSQVESLDLEKRGVPPEW